MEDRDVTQELNYLEAWAREQGLVPAFRWPKDSDEVEASWLRLGWSEKGDGLMGLHVGAADGSWQHYFLIRGDHFETAVREASHRLDEDNELPPPPIEHDE